MSPSYTATAQVNLFRGSYNPTPYQTLSLAQALKQICIGTYQAYVTHLRQLLTTNHPEDYTRGKAHLDAITPCGTFKPRRAKEHLSQHNGIVHGDLDHLQDLAATRQALCSDPHTVYCFISPSGAGFKVGVRVNPVADDAAYKHAWQAVADYHQHQDGIAWDPSGKDISRLCFMSWDPECYVNPEASLFPLPAMVIPPPRPQTPRPSAQLPADRRQRYASQALETATRMLDASGLGNRHHARTKAAYLLGGYVAGGILDYSEAYAALEAAVTRNTDHVPAAMKTIADCLQAGMEAAINLEDLEADRHSWLEEHRAMPTHSATRSATPNGQSPAIPGPEGAPAGGGEAAGEDTRPVIRISTEMTAVVDAMQQAILKAPASPVVFQRARRLCHIARGLTPPAWLDRALDAPVIAPAAPAYLRELASQTAQWQKLDKRAKRWEPALPPPWAVETLQARASWPFHPLTGLVQAPTIRPDGSILTTPGYDAATGLYLDLSGVDYPQVRSRPTLDEARSAIGHLQEAVRDFPWAHPQHDFSATLAALLSLAARYAIQGNVPLFAVRSTTRASGKGLLVDVVSTIATGRHAPRWAQTLDEEEEHKRLVTVGLAGDLTVHIDNVVHPLGSGPLDLAITAETISGRILGTQKEIEVPMRVVFFASGNNMVFKGDMARRVMPIDLDPRMERPEERDNFAHPLLLGWVLEERPRLLIAAVTILRAYVEAGRPAQGVKPLGSFEQWSMLVRQALIWAGEADPCEGRKDIEAESDPDFEAFRLLLACWSACYATEHAGVTLKRALQDALHLGEHDPQKPGNAYDELRDALGALDPRYDGKTLRSDAMSYRLRAWKGRVIDGQRLVKAGEDNRATRWRIETL